VVELVCKYSFSQNALYHWRAKYGEIEASALRRLKMLKEENRRLKKAYANPSTGHAALRGALEKG